MTTNSNNKTLKPELVGNSTARVMDSDSGNNVLETIESSLQDFTSIEAELKQKLQDFRTKREVLEAQKGGEMVTVWMMDSWSTADALHKKEEDLIKYREEKHKLDCQIVDSYEKVIVKQLRKLTDICKNLKSLQCKSPSQKVPPDCRVAAFQSWTKENKEISKLESHIFKLLGLKIRLNKRIAEQEEEPLEKRGRTISVFDEKFHQIYKKDSPCIEQYPFEDSLFSKYIRELIGLSGTNFEAMQIKNYIKQCRKEYTDILNGKTQYNDANNLPANPVNYQSFICAVTEYILNKHGKFAGQADQDSFALFNQIYAIIEEILFPQIYEYIKLHVVCQEKDAQIDARFHLFHNVDAIAVGIKERFIDTQLLPYWTAISKLRKMSIAITPYEKLKCILLAAKDVIEFMNGRIDDKSHVPGADEFMDVWVYVVLKSKLPNLISTVSLVRNYSNPRISLSEAGYYLSSFELAGEYIGSLELDSFGQSSGLQNSQLEREAEKLYFLPEQESCLKFSQKSQSVFVVVETDVLLSGFRLIADLDLQLERSRLISTFVEIDATSVVKGCLVKRKNDDNECALNRRDLKRFLTTQCKRLSNDIKFLNNNERILLWRDTQAIDCRSSSDNEQQSLSRYVYLPSGQYDDNSLLLQNYLSLERLGCVKRLETLHEIGGDIIHINQIIELLPKMTDLFLQNFQLYDERSLQEKIQYIVQDIQVRLRDLGLYTKILSIDGVYGLATIHSVRLFQIACNENKFKIAIPFLPEDGICDFDIYSLIYNVGISEKKIRD